MKIPVDDNMTQGQIVLEHLKQNPKGITPMEAIRYYSITRLSGRIFELRKMGYRIMTTTETKRKGKRVMNYARYTLRAGA